jgi:Glycosyltransferases involved in cell wall biogenesis
LPEGTSKRLRVPTRLTEQRWESPSSPVLTVLCTAYNQEAYIAEAIESFLMQETTFPVEIVIHDDASTDGTASIVSSYAERDPQIIRAILQTENQKSRGKWALRTLMNGTSPPFIAICEGDDYWTVPEKLEPQMTLLEANSRASGCAHRADGLFENSGELIPGYYGPYVQKPAYGVDDLLVKGNFVPTHSIILRRHALGELPEWLDGVPHLDIALLCMAMLNGPLLYIDRSMGVYRKHDGGIHSRDHVIDQQIKNLQTYFKIGEKLGLSDAASFNEGMQRSFMLIRNRFVWYEERISELEQQHADDRKNVGRIMTSRTFRVGMALSRFRDKFVDRRQR